MVDLSDIQGIVRTGYNHLPFSYSVFLQIDDAAAARVWLQSIIGKLMTAAHWDAGEGKPPSGAQVAFTWEGLSKIGLRADALQEFSYEFRVGMADPGRSPVLGDIGGSAPENWQVGGTPETTPHVLLLVFADTTGVLDAVTNGLWNSAAPGSGLREIFRQYSNRDDEFEPFGFRDGISQPAVEGVTQAALPGQTIVKRGEFLLGHINEYNEITPSIPVWSKDDTTDVLPVMKYGKAGQKNFGLNGSYLIWRKLQQDVAGFWDFCEDQTRNADGSANETRKAMLAAKFIGRWPSGCPLTLSPDRDDPDLGANKQLNNNFLFMPTDSKGFGCPIGSHMRRGNPRDGQITDLAHSQALSARHRIMRRGRPYTDNNPDGTTSEGLAFIALNADIQRQFEFIQQTWMNSPKLLGLYDNPDPILSTGNATMTIQASPARQQIHNLPRFVMVRGGGYFFLPGIRALRFLAAQPAAHQER